ncbi:Kinesin light chain 3 [Aphanomyces cochlioides]|nr:Kinesin light chain 3 [Aphanomyces cochlioides]
MVEHVRQQPDGHLYVKPATWFVSHAWSYLYLDVVDALDDFFQENGLDDSVAVWFCTFCNNQHEIQDQVYDFDHWFGIFRSSLRSVGNVVMVMSPWNNPTTLRRTWCVFEVYASVVENARFEIAMGRSQKASFLQDIQDDGAFFKMLSTIQSEKSETTIPSDRDNIFQLIRDEVGFVKLDRMVFEVLEKWMLRTVDQQIKQAADVLSRAGWLMVKGSLLRKKGQYVEAVDIYQTAHDVYLREKGVNFPETWNALAGVASSKVEIGGSLEEVQSMLEEVVDHQTRLVSKDHKETLSTMNRLGNVYSRQTKYDIAMPLLVECFERQCQLLGEEHMSTRETMSEISIVCVNQNKLEEALEWSLRCFKIQCRVLGEDHPNTSRMQNDVAILNLMLGNFEAALPHAAASYNVFRRTLGHDHMYTLITQANLGNTYRLVGNYEAAELTLLDCLKHIQTDDLAKAVCDTRALPIMFSILRKAGRFAQLEEIDAFQNELVQAECDQEIWKNMQCHGCRLEIHGLLYECSNCIAYSLRYCRACVALNKPSSFCNHGADAIESTKPMVRFLDEE